MKKTISSNRLTIDLIEKSKSILEKLKAEMQRPFGQIINMMVITIGNAPPAVQKNILSYCKQLIKEQVKLMDVASPFELKEISDNIEALQNLAMFMNGGRRISLDELTDEPEMVRYDIEGGYVICPSDWIVVNPEMARQCIRAGVVECRVKNKMPHLLFFTNLRSSKYDDKFEKEINSYCIKAYPQFEEILRQQIKPIDDPARPGQLLNSEEWVNSPHIGYFELYEQGDNSYPADYQPPYNAMVVHTVEELKNLDH